MFHKLWAHILQHPKDPTSFPNIFSRTVSVYGVNSAVTYIQTVIKVSERKRDLRKAELFQFTPWKIEFN